MQTEELTINQMGQHSQIQQEEADNKTSNLRAVEDGATVDEVTKVYQTGIACENDQYLRVPVKLTVYGEPKKSSREKLVKLKKFKLQQEEAKKLINRKKASYEGQYKCIIGDCEQRFFKIDRLYKHRQRWHQDYLKMRSEEIEKRRCHQCTGCDRRFVQKQCLKDHMKSHLKGDQLEDDQILKLRSSPTAIDNNKEQLNTCMNEFINQRIKN